MELFTNRDTKFLFTGITVFIAGFLLLSQIGIWVFRDSCIPFISVLSVISGGGIAAVCFWYFYQQHKLIGVAVSAIDKYLKGDTNARIACDREGELYKLFHSVNTLAAVLNAHAENELRSKEFLRDTISDISHQLKTPIAALSIYNEMVQGEAERLPEIKKFTILSEQELNRIETLVQNLLEITKLDAGTIIIEKTGSGIHPKDIHYIFKRFYRSRFSKDTQGIGLGLPLARAIIEAHDGNITVDSESGKGSVFNITFLNSDKLTKL